MDRETEATLADKGITQGPTQKDNRLSAIRSAASRKTLLRDVCGLRRPCQIPFLGIIDFRIAMAHYFTIDSISCRALNATTSL